MTLDPTLLADLAPTGALRASINLGNPILAGLDAQRQPAGVSVDLANALAQRLGVALELVVVDAAGKSVDVVSQEQADVGFFAIDPRRAASIRFTEPYVLIEGWYLVRADSPIRGNAEVDRAGNRVVVGQGSAYDLFLTRELRHAEIVRAPTSPAVVQTFLDTQCEVAAGVRQQLEADAAHRPGLRLLDERFMVIRQAMGVPAGRGPRAAQYVARFVEEMKASGFVERALQRHGVTGVSIAPAAVV
ncbi:MULTISPECIES: ABC transporter substrate-binding protein [Ralstonia solanacearum species complex]|uniref:ABC transporter substrate-binding protein n=6 Tax=Ralstonia solanacearum species complex TaxID=3116862 RepID=A0A0S4UUB7_RALSL|nr:MULTISPECIES: ABC transporter substrate-binding protein [Ralstonia]ANH34992.1 extracellular solute-binding protein [Ralstonia solanacearum]APC65944.1 ABC transporter substrate-binding protein [Ralstonia solanacearum OE1-1]AGH86141.1 putative extracellular solute-binding protein [Ralstonia pseudosolanacearum FQY_4]API76787.1 ABC transporter substrate-binding protein [Ralstonia pseudosolanacearum]ARU24301.1 2-methylisocitrate lyase [Ralstonia solanacearum]